MSPEETQARFEWYDARVKALRLQAYDLLWAVHHGNFGGHGDSIPENCHSGVCRDAMEAIGDDPQGAETVIQPILDQVTEEYLRPALLAAGLDPEKYKLVWAPGEPAQDPMDLYPEATDEP